jgi:hypothetical protein
MSDIRSFEIDLDLKQNILVTLPCKQLDNLNIKFNIWNNGQVADINNYKCRLKALKSDYTPLIQNTDISISDNIVTVEADEQLTTTSGMVKTELQFIDKTTGKKKSSFNLNIKVVSGALEVDRTISKATITLLEQLDNKLDQIEDIEAVVEEAKIVKDELVTKTNEANTIKNELEAATTNAENKENEINTAVTNANNKIEEVNISISNANASKEALDTSKKNADTLKESLDESIDIGNTLKTNLDEANSLATNNKTALDNSNQNATNTKNELEELNSNATNIKNELDNSNSLAATNKSELDKANNLAQTNKTALDEANTLAEHNIEELNKLGDVTELAKQVETNKTDIASINNKIGTTELTTNDKSITGAIEEVKEIADNNTTQLKDLANLNLFINGGFSVWQRGTSFSTNGYTADRWMYDVEGDDKGKIVRHANGGVQIKLISNKRFWFMQRIELNQELKNIFSNSTVTLSFYVTTSAGVKISPYIRVWSPSRNANIFLKSYEAKATRQLIECQITLGDLSSDDWLGIDIFRIEEDNKFTVGDDLYIRFENAKFELGSKATPFVPRLYGEELALCQRFYYEENWSNVVNKVLFKIATSNCDRGSVCFPVTMRINPTLSITWSDETESHAEYIQGKGYDSLTTSGFTPFVNRTSEGMNDINFVPAIKKYTADAEIY